MYQRKNCDFWKRFFFYLQKVQLNEYKTAPYLFNSAKTGHVIVCWFLCFSPNLPELNLTLFCSNVQNNFKFSPGKFGGKHRNQQTITSQVLAELNKYGAVSYSLNCTVSLLETFAKIQTMTFNRAGCLLETVAYAWQDAKSQRHFTFRTTIHINYTIFGLECKILWSCLNCDF